jgi:hypothetical protein
VGGGLPKREHFGVGGRILVDLAPVVATPDDLAASDDDGPDGHVASRTG